MQDCASLRIICQLDSSTRTAMGNLRRTAAQSLVHVEDVLDVFGQA
jgi:hypothetical protein